MKKSHSLIFLILLWMSIMPKGLYANAMSYEEYQKSTEFCDNTKEPWNQTVRSVKKITYPELEVTQIQKWMTDQEAKGKDQSAVIQQEIYDILHANKGQNEGPNILQVVGGLYNIQMNNVFDCAILESRIGVISGLKQSGTLKGQSEVLNKLNKELQKLNSLYTRCLPSTDQKNDSSETSASHETGLRLVNTATYNYCQYRHYLNYMESNFENDYTRFMSIDANIFSENNSRAGGNSDATLNQMLKNQNTISDAIRKADLVLPQAIAGYKEMERTYATHLLLMILYDDYIRLRDNLAKYMNATSQLFEKAYNAMGQ